MSIATAFASTPAVNAADVCFHAASAAPPSAADMPATQGYRPVLTDTVDKVGLAPGLKS
jgi:hypothetical protein